MPLLNARLSARDERELIKRWQRLRDRAALARLIATQQGTIRRTVARFQHFGIAFEDLVQEGNLALIQAANRFDPKKRTRFVTYATYWIRARLFQQIFQYRGQVRIGRTHGERRVFFGLARARHKLERNGEHVTAEQLAHELGVKQTVVESMMPRMRVRDLSLDAAFDGEPVLQLAAPSDSPEELVAAAEESRIRECVFRSGLGLLNSREKQIVAARHLREEPATLATLGSRLRVSKERVRQIEVRAKAKLAAHAAAKLNHGE